MKEQSRNLLLFILMVKAYMIPMNITLFEESRYVYHLNIIRLFVMFVVAYVLRDLFRKKVVYFPLGCAVFYMLLLGTLFSWSTPLVTFDHYIDTRIVWWILLQLQTVITEGLLFFVLLSYLLKAYVGIEKGYVSVAIFALAHGVSLFTPVIFLVGMFYMKVYKKHGFMSHILVHFVFNLTQILFFDISSVSK